MAQLVERFTHTHAIIARFSELRSNLAERYARRAIYRNTLAELRSLGRRELNDLGIAPGDLERIAREAAYK